MTRVWMRCNGPGAIGFAELCRQARYIAPWLAPPKLARETA